MERLLINKIEVVVATENVDKIIQNCTSSGCIVESADNHAVNSLSTILSNASKYANPPLFDSSKFASEVYSAAAMTIRIFYLKNFQLLVISSKAMEELVEVIFNGCPNEETSFVSSTYDDAESVIQNFDITQFHKKDLRNKLVEDIKKMDEILQKVDIEPIKEELKKVTGVNLKACDPNSNKVYIIGEDKYPYNTVAL